MNESVILSTMSESITFLDEYEGLNCDSLPSQLFGRDRESNTLKQKFEQLRNSGGKNFAKVLVHGESGSGKTLLVESLRQSVLDSQGFFVSGKYFQTLGNQEPYSAIMAAFSDLCDLISQSARYNEEQLLTIQKKLRPDHAYLLQKTISNITPFLDTTLERSATHSVDVQNTAMFSTFKDACKCFLQAMSCADHPIVLFIDDIQWMDESSKKLITFLWNDRDISGIMLILAYRDEDTSNLSHVLSQLDSEDEVLNIGIKNLDVNDINILVKSLIGSSSKSANQALSKVFKFKTGGNPFHLIQIIQFAKDEGLLSYNVETKFWDFDVEAIQTQIMVSETLADLLTKKILILPHEVQESLKIASLLGFRFREDMMAQVKSWMDDQLSGEHEMKASFDSSSWVSITLSEALNGGFVKKCTYGYLFSHDKLQSAFQSLLSKDEASRMHKTIGEIYLAKGDPESVYHAVNHLQLCEEYTMNINKNVEFAQMHLIAANYCRERSAFIQARDLFRWGLTLLGDEKWKIDFDLAFQFTESLAKMELIIGNFDSCSMLTKICLDRATSRDMKIDSLITNVETCMARNDLNASSLAANHALHELGVTIPIKTSFFHVVTKFMKVKWLIGHKTDEEILNLPQMTDKVIVNNSSLACFCLCMHCFLRDEETQGAYAALLATEITLRNGLSAYSPAAFAIYGVAELSNGHYLRAYRFGKLALDILKRSESRAAESYTKGLVMASLSHWFDPLNGMPIALRQAAQHGFHIGDVVS
jgi:histidine kinase